MQFLEFSLVRHDTNQALAYGKLTVYLTGTTTKAALFDQNGVSIGNPLTADGAGLAGFAAVNGTYDFQMQSADGVYSLTIPKQQMFDLQAVANALAAGTVAGILAKVKDTLANLNADLVATDGQLALVYNDPVSINNDLYAKLGASGSGSWQGPLGFTPNAANAAVALVGGAIKLVEPTNFVGGLADSFGRYFLGVRANGSIVIPSLEVIKAVINSITIAGSSFALTAPYGYSYGWADSYGRFVAGIKNDGTFEARKISGVDTINGTSMAAIATAANPLSPIKPILDAEINGFCFYGQSKPAGTQSIPVLTTSALYDGLRFSDGVRPYDTTTPLRNAFVPLIETDNGLTGTAQLAETPSSGMDATIKQRILADHGIAYTDQPYQMLMTVEAQGGSPIANLQVGTTYYNNVKADIAAMQTVAQAAGKTSKFRAWGWSQGESDYNVSTSGATYRSALTAIQTGLDAYAKTLNPDNGDVLCLIDQVFAHATYGHSNDPYIALLQLAMSEDTPGLIMIGNLSHLPNSGFPHWTNQGSQWAGAYYGRAYKRLFIEKGVWEPLKPVDFWRDGNVVMLRFTPESGKLAFDTATVAAQTNKGFNLVDASNVAITINTVELVGADMVKITAASAVPANAKIRAGFQAGGKTNLRDTTGDTITATVGANTYALHNWCVIFEKTLA